MDRPIGRDIIVIGGSAGAIRPLETILTDLPGDLPASVFVVLHRALASQNLAPLPKLLTLSARLRIEPARDNGRFESACVYVGPADRHLVLDPGLMRLEDSPKEQHFRPSIDVLFRSAASAYGRRVIGVLLSGRLEDGTPGLWQIKSRGGVAVVQHPGEAEFVGMVDSAIEHVQVDHILRTEAIGGTLVRLTEPSETAETSSPRILIVEDDAVVAANLQQALTGMGYVTIDAVASGEAAIAIAEREHPDLVLMDIGLAGKLTGIEVARTIWRTVQAPIVYCTALSDADTLNEAKTTENYGYVVKPFHSEGIRAAVEVALDRRRKELDRLPTQQP